jgi:type VI secretion system protein ImpE
MNAIDLIREGRLLEARKLLVEEVKSSPSDAGRRTLLFQVLIFLGEWDKAGRHLETIAAQDPGRDVGVQIYKNLITAEEERIEVIRLKKLPSFLPETPSYFETYYAGLKKLVEKKQQEAKDHFDQTNAKRPILSGTVNGRSFTGFSDTDTFLSPFLEAIVHERYVWVPFESIRELAISPPKTLFDLIWAQARITTWEGLTMNCFLPVLYPDSSQHEDERIKLGRMTDWISLGGSFSKGVGQHVFQIGEEEMAILEIREALFDYKKAI